jgi:hypothetical protein
VSEEKKMVGGEPFELKDEDGRVWAQGVTPKLPESARILGLTTDRAVEIELSRKSNEQSLAVQQTEALTVLAKATNEIASFITGGGLSTLLSGYARSQAVKEILGGLAAHDGRNSLDARVLGQNALEITEAVELVFKKYSERVAEKNRDPEIHKAVEPEPE